MKFFYLKITPYRRQIRTETIEKCENSMLNSEAVTDCKKFRLNSANIKIRKKTSLLAETSDTLQHP